MHRDSVILVAGGIILLCLTCNTCLAVDEQHRQRLAEIYYVQGCQDSDPLRETANCFEDDGTGARESIRLSLRGTNFPASSADDSIEVLLKEHVPVPPLGTDSAATPGAFGEDGEDEGETPWTTHANGLLRAKPRKLSCRDVTFSPLFPSQLLSCKLPNPAFLDDKSAHGGEPSSWMDVIVRRSHSHNVVAVLRRAVQVHWRQSPTPSQATNGAGKQDLGPPSKVPAMHPLESFYISSARRAHDDVVTDDINADASLGERTWAELGVGGLNRELHQLFRRAFLSRLPSLANVTRALAVQHVRGIILHGPPGNGKTLIARSLAKLLGPAADISIVNAAEVLSKYVGESEKNLRDVFEGLQVGTSVRKEENEEAFDEDTDDVVSSSKDTEERPQEEKLHILVFDEFDALFRRRGHSSDESSAKAVYDGMTNSLLSLMDGMESRNDILVIGITNRLELIDRALIRPGRFELLIEVPAPDKVARESIFFIHTERLRQSGMLGDDVDLAALAEMSSSFSGSDIAGVVRSAVSRGLLRYRDALLRCPTCDADETAFRVSHADLRAAIDEVAGSKINDGKAALHQRGGTGDGIVDFDGRLGRLTNAVQQLLHQVRSSRILFGGVVHVTGPRGTGRSTAAEHASRAANFSSAQVVSCRRLANAETQDAAASLRESFADVSRSDSGVLILDDIDAVLDSTPEFIAQLGEMVHEFRYSLKGVGSVTVGSDSGDDIVSLHLRDEQQQQEGLAAGAVKPLRLLIMTSTHIPASSSDDLLFDVHYTTRRLRRQAVATALKRYRIAAGAGKGGEGNVAALAGLYPPEISIRNFLRLTDRAVWAAQASLTADPDKEEEARFAFPVVHAPDAPNEKTLEHLVGMETLAQSIRTVAVQMELQDSFADWQFTEDDAAEEASEVIW